MEELNHEQFEAKKELAKVSGEISTARATLMSLKSEIKTFLENRKEQEKEALKDLLNESSELVASINSNFTELKAFYNEVKSQVSFIGEMQDNVSTLTVEFEAQSKDFSDWVVTENEKMSEKRKELEDNEKDIRNERSKLEKERKEVEKMQKQIESRQKQIRSALEHLKKKQNE